MQRRQMSDVFEPRTLGRIAAPGEISDRPAVHEAVAGGIRPVATEVAQQLLERLVMVVRETVADVLVAEIAARAFRLEQAGFQAGRAAVDGVDVGI